MGKLKSWKKEAEYFQRRYREKVARLEDEIKSLKFPNSDDKIPKNNISQKIKEDMPRVNKAVKSGVLEVIKEEKLIVEDENEEDENEEDENEEDEKPKTINTCCLCNSVVDESLICSNCGEDFN